MIRAATLLLLAVVLLASATMDPARAQGLPPGVTPADRTAIQGVIGRQLDAFRHDDAAGAYGLAAPRIQRMFPTAEIFLDMVRRSYPPVYRPLMQEFSELALREGQVMQEVELVGPDGRAVVAIYTMERAPDGTWLIAGCAMIPSVRLGV